MRGELLNPLNLFLIKIRGMLEVQYGGLEQVSDMERGLRHIKAFRCEYWLPGVFLSDKKLPTSESESTFGGTWLMGEIE